MALDSCCTFGVHSSSQVLSSMVFTKSLSTPSRGSICVRVERGPFFQPSHFYWTRRRVDSAHQRNRERGDHMLTLIFILAIVWLAWKLLVWGIRAAWGVAKILGTVLLIPLFLFGLGCFGSIYLAIPILIIVGICALRRGSGIMRSLAI